jgi:hypothetical protein
MDDHADLGESARTDAQRLVRPIPPLPRADDKPTQDHVRPPQPAAPRMVTALSRLRFWRRGDTAPLPFYLMTVAAIIGAVITLRAAMLGSGAAESWARGTREETLRDNYLARMSDYVFIGTAPFELARVEATLYEQGLLHAARKSIGRARLMLLSEARLQRHVRRLTTKGDPPVSYTDSGLPLSDTYLSRPGLYVAGDHLASVLVSGFSPSEHQAAGDSQSTRATVAMSMTIPAAISFLFGTLAFALPRRRRLLLLLGFVAILASVTGLLLSVLGVV